MTLQTMTLGYARIGKRRELKKALETFWSGVSGADALLTTLQDLETNSWQAQLDTGVVVAAQTLWGEIHATSH